MNRPSYLRLVRASAWYDLVVTAGFATPWSYVWLHDLLSSLGSGELPALDPIQILYANLLGSVVVVWSVLRIARPLPVYGLYDGIARALFATWQAYALGHGAFSLLWAFLVFEAAFGIAQLVPWLAKVRATAGESVGR